MQALIFIFFYRQDKLNVIIINCSPHIAWAIRIQEFACTFFSYSEFRKSDIMPASDDSDCANDFLFPRAYMVTHKISRYSR